ncbi:DNA topoisomerase IV [Flavobacterium sp.]|uniref:DNA topoisomerase IV n=1 Tax=Flavobacterium sp. TaxID=239 RepID=UPI0008D5D918|nr:DNA topoisomerase IV [Flavobacterium sp.]OGS62290.1 MAG: DNA topoisomerase IV [Flavobacteria bacterium GWF1_32_7]HBD26822.1 DNA topoisomerase IV [Flavobacterium sp.]
MKFIFILFSALLMVSCYNQERNCTDFKTGKFTSETEIEGKKYTSTFERNDSIQIESYEGKIDTFKVRWTNDCEYIIQNTNPKNREEKKPVQMKILTTNSDSYTFEYSFVGDSKKQRGTVTKQN